MLKTYLTMALLIVTLSTQSAEVINKTFFGDLAVQGFDTVMYFTENKAVEGNKKYQMQWKGAYWLFTSAENLKLFHNNPEMYAPQYGGYCAYAMSNNETVSIEPEQFTILNGKLYLNFNKKINTRWQADRANYIIEADSNWAKLVAKEY